MLRSHNIISLQLRVGKNAQSRQPNEDVDEIALYTRVIFSTYI